MCKGRTTGCELLGTDPDAWSRFEPLPAPAEATHGLELFAQAAQAAADGDLREARSLVARVDSDALRRWYIEHALWAGDCRRAILGRPRPPPASLDPLRHPRRRDVAAVVASDGYRCRYCRRKVVTKSLFGAVRSLLGDPSLPMGTSDAATHGLVLASSAVIDHVYPWSLGGRTERSNLVTACYPCNFGKADHTLEELGIEKPRSPILDGWDGLQSLVPGLTTRFPEG